MARPKWYWILLLPVLLPAQLPPDKEDPVRLPSGKTRNEEILKAEHAASLKDAAELVKLSEELKIDLEKNDRYVVSVGTIKKAEEIEKLAKRIRGRLKRY